MKLVIASTEGEGYFDLLDETGIADLHIVRTSSPEQVRDEIADADVFYGFPTADQVAAARKLRLIQSPGAGVDWIARVPGVADSDVIVTNTRGAHAPSIAEHVFSLLLTFTRDIRQTLEWQGRHYWGRTEGYKMLHEINGGTMGIIGYGAIGHGIGRRAAAFDMNVLALDANPVQGDDLVPDVWPSERLPDLLAQSDVVVVAVPLTPATRHLIDAAALEQMRPDAHLIAISRGGVVDEEALMAALRDGKIAGAGIDVAETEPLPADSPLWDTPNLVITPHVAGASGPKERRCVEILRENLVRFANGDELVNVVDKHRGY